MMKRLLPTLWTALLLGGLMSGMLRAGAITTATEAVNLAGKQRMYTMRLLRDYIMIGAKLNYRNPQEDLKHTLADFEASHEALKAYVTDPALQEELKAIDAQWHKIKTMMSQPPERSKAAEYAKGAIDFREMLNDFTNHLSKASGQTAAEAVNLSGRMRAVSQALAAGYLLRTWGLKEAKEKLKIPMKRFRASLDYLHKAPETGEAMRAKLDRLEKIYLFFEVMNGSDTFVPTLVIKKTDTMLKVANELTQLYVDAHKK
jgi:nitrate/nitrite-specific signal transduction histidine kinase